MRNLCTRTAGLLGLAVMVLCAYVPLIAHAQTAPPATNDILPFYQGGTESAKAYFEACKASMASSAGLSCTYDDPTADITTRCSVSPGGWDCTFTKNSDGSRVVADKNLIIGSNFINYDSNGTLVGNRDTGVGGDSGTGEGAANLSEANCSEGSLSSCLRNLPGMLLVGIGFLFLTLAGLILAVVGVVFNFVIIRTVFQFGTYFGTSEGMLAAWGVMRDIANIGLLFGFILMGVLLILNVDGGGHGHGHGGGISAKKAIPRLIIFAVLLNFSLFASQAVIDVSNAFSASFATLAGEECATTAGEETAAGGSAEKCVNEGIAGKILSASGLTGIWNSSAMDNGTMTSNSLDKPYSYAVSLIMLAVFVLITAMVLLAGAIMLIIRVVYLSLLMVTSPVGFAGLAIPKLQNIAGMWWSKLISQSFFAPIYLLLIFISIKLTEGLMGDGATLANALMQTGGDSVSGNMQVIMVFLIVIGFMIGSLIAASKMGAMGSSFASNSASALTFGALTRSSNLIAGGAGAGISRLSRAGLRPGQAPSKTRLRFESAGNALQKANIDTRRAPGMTALLGAAGISAGAKPAEHATFADMQHQYSDGVSGSADKKRLRDAAGRMALKQLEDNAHNNAMSTEDEKTLASLSTKELEELHGIKEGVQQLAQKLTPEQFENLMKSDKIDDSQKNALRDGRFSLLAKQVTTGSGAEIRKWSNKDLEQLGNSPAFASLLADPVFASSITDDQFDAINKSGRITANQKVALENARNERFNVANAAATVSSMNTEQISKLKGDILAKPQVFQNLSLADFEKIRDKGSLSASQRATIGVRIADIASDPKNPEQASYMAYVNSDPRVKSYWNIP